MLTARVLCQTTCNQACSYCDQRRESDDPQFAGTEAVRARIEAAIREGAGEIVLSGGEPTLRPDLAELVRQASGGRARAVALETNALLLDVGAIARLMAAGLTSARVNLTVPGAELDAITRDAGGHLRTWAGLAALLAAGLPVEILAVVIQSTRDSIATLPAALAAAFGPAALKGIEMAVPVDAPNRSECLPYPQAVPVIVALADEAARLGLTLTLAAHSGPPPCLFPHPGRVTQLFGLGLGTRTRRGFKQLRACAGCALADRCPGVAESYLRRNPPPLLRPITSDRLRRRVETDNAAEQAERDLVQISHLKGAPGPGEPRQEHLIRVNFVCNQACRFCFVATHLPTAGDDRVVEAIRFAAAEDARIVLTGGEPTLHPELIRYIALARSLSAHPVWLQTNATRLDEPVFCAEVVAAGVGAVLVSLHAADADLSDQITAAPGTHKNTLAGLDRLSAQPVQLTLNTVITGRNVGELDALAQLVAERWPRARWNLSFVSPTTGLVPRDADTVPRYSDAVDALSAAWRLATAAGVDVSGPDIPSCVLPDDVRLAMQLPPIREDAGGEDYVRVAACVGCSLRGACLGVRRGYLAMYGDGEVVRRVEPDLPALPV